MDKNGILKLRSCRKIAFYPTIPFQDSWIIALFWTPIRFAVQTQSPAIFLRGIPTDTEHHLKASGGTKKIIAKYMFLSLLATVAVAAAIAVLSRRGQLSVRAIGTLVLAFGAVHCALFAVMVRRAARMRRSAVPQEIRNNQLKAASAVRLLGWIYVAGLVFGTLNFLSGGAKALPWWGIVLSIGWSAFLIWGCFSLAKKFKKRVDN